MSMARLRQRIRALLFDWGDTLVRPPGITTDGAGHFRCVEAFFHEELAPALAGAGAPAALDWPRFRELYGRATMEQIRRTLATGREHSFARRIAHALELGDAPGVLDTTTCTALADALGERIAAGCAPIAGALELLPRLHGRFRLGLLSNYPHAPAVRMSLASAGLLDHLDSITISAEIGWSKPSRPAFEAAITGLGAAADEILFVGDDLDNDMRGAKAMGMHTAWLPRADQDAGVEHAFVDLRLESLAELAALAHEVPPQPPSAPPGPSR